MTCCLQECIASVHIYVLKRYLPFETLLPWSRSSSDCRRARCSRSYSFFIAAQTNTSTKRATYTRTSTQISLSLGLFSSLHPACATFMRQPARSWREISRLNSRAFSSFLYASRSSSTNFRASIWTYCIWINKNDAASYCIIRTKKHKHSSVLINSVLPSRSLARSLSLPLSLSVSAQPWVHVLVCIPFERHECVSASVTRHERISSFICSQFRCRGRDLMYCAAVDCLSI